MNSEELSKLVEEYKAGKKAVMGSIYSFTIKKVYLYIYSKVGNKNWTEDIVSETYLTLFGILSKFDGSSKLETFIIGIANNKIRQYFSKIKESHSLEDEEEFLIVEDDELEESTKNKFLKEKLNEILKKLPENYQNVLIYRFIKSNTIKDTAKILKISEANVRVIQNRAIKKAVEIANQININ